MSRREFHFEEGDSAKPRKAKETVTAAPPAAPAGPVTLEVTHRVDVEPPGTPSL